MLKSEGVPFWAKIKFRSQGSVVAMPLSFTPIVPLLQREDSCSGPNIQLGNPAKGIKIFRTFLPVPLAGSPSASPETLTQILISSLELRPTYQIFSCE